MKKYYIINATTVYDGYEFGSISRCERDFELSKEDVKEIAESMFVHYNSGEDLIDVRFKQISKKEYDVFKKYKI